MSPFNPEYCTLPVSRLKRGPTQLLGAAIILPLVILAGLVALDRSSGSAHDFSPPRVLSEGFRLFRMHDTFGIDPALAAWTSVVRVACCIIASAVLGSALGILFSLMGRMRLLFLPTIDFLRSLPITFLLVPLIYVVGITHGRIPWILACVPCSLIICVCVVDRAVSIDSDRLFTLRAFFGKNEWRPLLRHVYIYEVFAGFVTGVRIAIPYAAILVAVLEYVGAGSAAPGFGHLIQGLTGSGTGDEATIAAVIVYGVFSVLLTWGAQYAARRLVTWQPGE